MQYAESLLFLVNSLLADGFESNLSGNPTDGFYNGDTFLPETSCSVYFIVDDYTSERIHVGAVTSACGIKGTAIYN